MSENKPVKVEASKVPERASEEMYSPLVDIVEADDGLVLTADVPGAGKDDINVSVDKGVLTIEADARFEVPGQDYARTHVSFVPGKFQRAFALSDEIDRDKISATVSKGVLTVTLPKAAEARSRKIEIKLVD